jgi:ribonucleoside-diphosphate reductase alpha chain
MQVITRNDEEEPLNLNKITDRIKKLCYNLSDEIDPAKLTIQITSQIKDRIRTSEIDELSCLVCLQQITDHPDFGVLAARISINNHHKDNQLKFHEFIEKAYNNTDILGNRAPLVSEELVEIAQTNKDKIIEWIDYERDYNLNCFGFKTLQRAYLLRTADNKYMERPGDMFMRVAIGIHGWDNDGLDAKETYEYMSRGYFTHATPTLFNAGTQSPQMSSCFLMGLEDSVEGIYNGLKDAAHISKHSGGIGIHIHDIRSRNSYIRKTGGRSSGILPMLKVFNETARYINQGGKRNGSFAMYLEPHHPDIFEFLDAKRPQGSEEAKARDLFFAMWISDLFMERVKNDSNWTLFCPDTCPRLSDVWGDEYRTLYEQYESENLGVKTIKARDLWEQIITTQIETGGPYMLYKDSVNKKSNQKNVGTIKSSNLCCVTGDTMILTDNGHIKISELQGKTANVWNGETFSESSVFKTHDNAEIIDVKFSDGMTLNCTRNHKFVLHNPLNSNENVIKYAEDLKPGDKLVKCSFPVIDNIKDTIDYPYTNGYFAGRGEYLDLTENTYDSSEAKRKRSNVEEKKPCISFRYYHRHPLSLIDNFEGCIPSNYKHYKILILDSDKTLPRNFIPKNCSLQCKLDWFAGYCDANGEIANKNGCQTLQLYSDSPKFLADIKLMLQTCGVNANIAVDCIENSGEPILYEQNSRVFGSDTLHYLTLSSFDMHFLINLGLRFKKLNVNGYMPTRNYVKYISVQNVFETKKYAETFCFNEPEKHMGIFNGIYSHNCEITEYSDTEEYAVCNLASIALPKLVKENGDFDFDLLQKITKILVGNLNKIIDKNYYPLEKCKKSNLRHRPIGLGVQGLADAFVKMGLPFDSMGAKLLNKHIFQTIYYASVEASADLASIHGSYETFENSPSNQGQFQFDMWNVEPDNDLGLDWETLREKMKAGMRNSLLVAPMPTASTSQILGCNECFEPYTSNIYTRRTLAGEFTVINQVLIRELIKLKMWNEKMKSRIIIHEGSIQNINCIPDRLKDLFKTAWEIKQKCILDMAIERGPYICQSQSLNVFVKTPTFAILNSLHTYGFENGLKTGTYYIHSRPASKAQNFTIDPNVEKEILMEDQKGICEFCSG